MAEDQAQAAVPDSIAALDAGFDWSTDQSDHEDDGFVDTSEFYDEDEPTPPEGEATDEEDSDDSEETDSDDLFTLKVGGAEHTVTRDEVIRLAQQGQDYTFKTQELSQQKKALEPLVQLASALDENPEGTLRWLAEQYGIDLQADVESEDPRDREMRKLRNDLQAIQKQTAIEEQKRLIASEVSALQAEYGEFDGKALVQFAAENRLLDMRTAYLTWVGHQSLAQRQKAQTTQARKQAEVVEQGPSRRQAATVPPKGKMTVKQAFDAAVAASKR